MRLLSLIGFSALLLTPTGTSKADVALDDPNGTYEIKELNGGNTIKLTGRIGTLKVGLVDGASTLDASGLNATTIEFYDKIDGRSTVRLKGGQASFRAKIDGKSQVTICCDDVDFRDKIDGGSDTFVRVDAKRSLKFKELNGGARLHYTTNPGLNLQAGKVDGGGTELKGVETRFCGQ